MLRNRVVCKQRLRSQVHRERGRLRLALFLLEDDVPSGEIMDDFKHGHLHSGKKVKGKNHSKKRVAGK